MFQKREGRKKQKELYRLMQIADAFLKARGVYPPDHDEFLALAGRKEVTVFQETMYLLEGKAQDLGYVFDWWYNQESKEWNFLFTKDTVPTETVDQ